MEHWYNDADKEYPKKREEKHVSLLCFPPQIQGLA